MKHLIHALIPVLLFYTTSHAQTCEVEFMILGAGQDAGAPQIGNNSDKAWADNDQKLLATSAALLDHRSGKRYLFEATPDIREQLHLLDQQAAPTNGSLGINGVFLTHAHIGHYAGLMFFGHESAGTKDIPVHAMPRMKAFLETNGPWSQLVDYNNISLQELQYKAPKLIDEGVSITPLQVPHRDEYSETVGFIISGPRKSALFLPDIDDWKRWETEFNIIIEDIIHDVDFAFIDATFYDDFELPGRDMSKIPHPRVKATLERFLTLAKSERSKLHFIHYNHSNPIRDPGSVATQFVLSNDAHIARRGHRFCLS